MKPKTFYNLLAEQNLPLSDQQKEQFERYFELLVEWNEKINLTAITDKGDYGQGRSLSQTFLRFDCTHSSRFDSQ